jgi:hypothetical protein
MKNVTYEEARRKFETLFELASKGEFVVIARNEQRVAIHSLHSVADQDVAPPGYFKNDYDDSDIAQLNSFAARGPKSPLP